MHKLEGSEATFACILFFLRVTTRQSRCHSEKRGSQQTASQTKQRTRQPDAFCHEHKQERNGPAESYTWPMQSMNGACFFFSFSFSVFVHVLGLRLALTLSFSCPLPLPCCHAPTFPASPSQSHSRFKRTLRLYHTSLSPGMCYQGRRDTCPDWRYFLLCKRTRRPFSYVLAIAQ